MLASLSFAESAVSLVEKGNAAYNAGKYDEALSAFDAAAKERPVDARIEFNRGAAFFRKGEMDKAKDAWEKAALGATDALMEAESLYNLGILEFSKLTQAQAADPKAALEAGDRSVRYYHEAKDLLANSPKYKNHSLIREASENIELARRNMKTIEEEMARREDAAKNQAQAAEDLKNLIDRQQDLNQRTQDKVAASQPDQKTPDGNQPEQPPLNDMAKEQSQLQDQTQKTAEKLAGNDAAAPINPATPDPAQAAKDHLAEAQARQKDAADKLNAGQASEAAKDQDAALEKMKNALDLLQYKEDQKKDSQGKDSQGKGDQKQQNPSSDSEKQTKKGEKKQDAEPQAEQGQTAAGNPENPENTPDAGAGSSKVLLPDDAERILNEEKENKKIRQQVSGAGGYQDVDKDW